MGKIAQDGKLYLLCSIQFHGNRYHCVNLYFFLICSLQVKFCFSEMSMNFVHFLSLLLFSVDFFHSVSLLHFDVPNIVILDNLG